MLWVQPCLIDCLSVRLSAGPNGCDSLIPLAVDRQGELAAHRRSGRRPGRAGANCAVPRPHGAEAHLAGRQATRHHDPLRHAAQRHGTAGRGKPGRTVAADVQVPVHEDARAVCSEPRQQRRCADVAGLAACSRVAISVGVAARGGARQHALQPCAPTARPRRHLQHRCGSGDRAGRRSVQHGARGRRAGPAGRSTRGGGSATSRRDVRSMRGRGCSGPGAPRAAHAGSIGGELRSQRALGCCLRAGRVRIANTGGDRRAARYSGCGEGSATW